MGRAKIQVQRRAGRGKSAEAPAGDAREGNGVQRRVGTERPDKPTTTPVVPADETARVIKS